MSATSTKMTQKDEGMEEFVCYCFKHTAEDIEEDIKIHGKSAIMEKIMSEKKAGNCQCKTKNPKGR